MNNKNGATGFLKQLNKLRG